MQVFGLNRPRLEHTRNLVEILYIYVVLVNNQVIYFVLFLCRSNRIGGVMVSVLHLSAVERGLEPRSGQTKDYKIGICCFYANRGTCWFGIRIMCPGGATCLLADGCFSELAL